MLGFALLAVTGAAVAAFVFDIFGDDDDPLPVGEDTPEEEITLSESGVLTGTSGDDIIVEADQVSDVSRINGGDGNDNITGLAETDIFGEGGDDTIQHNLFGFDTLDGGEGDDVITLPRVSSGNVIGGDGDDAIALNQSTNGSDWEGNSFSGGGQATIEGGEGDDTISGTLTSESVYAAPSLSGGEGSDTFEIDAVTTDFDYAFKRDDEELFIEFDSFGNPVGEIENPTIEGSLFARIEDFEPGVDTLEVDLRDTHDLESGAHTLSSISTDESENGTLIRFEFEAARPDEPSSMYTLTSGIFLAGVSDLSLEDDVVLLLDTGVSI